MIPDFVYGNENSAVGHLFADRSLDELALLSPVVLYGDKATGKTALAITLAVCWARRSRQRPLCFATGRSFSEEYLAAIEIDDVSSFRYRYRQAKLLVIDDLEPIITKPAAQIELLHTIDCLQAGRVPLIVTSGKLPASLDGIEESLSSRLSAGYSTCLSRPGSEARSSIIQDLVALIDPELNSHSIAQVCDQCPTLLTASQLMQVVTLSHQNRTANGSFDGLLLSQLIQQSVLGSQLSVAHIARLVAKKLRVKLSDLRGSTRQSQIVRARGLAMLLARSLTSSSLQEIGQFFGGRDHSTVLHACRSTASKIENDPELSKSLSELQAELLNV